MELRELTGLHVLDAVDFSMSMSIVEDPQVMSFRVDGIVYMAAEDPDDGYR